MNTINEAQAGQNGFLSLLVFFGLASVSYGAFASPPIPPVIISVDGQGVGHANPDGRYSLDDAIRGLPFTVNTPIPPQVEAEQIVTPSTLASYINTPGMRLILEPGNYGNRTFNSQDQQIILREGVYFGSVSIGANARRISIRNEVPRSGNMTLISMPGARVGGFPEDILIDGIRSDGGGNRNYVNGTRIAFLNSFIRTVDYPLSAFNGRHSDIIIANCNLEAYGSTQAGPRFHSIDRFVFVDNRSSKTGSPPPSGHHSWRLHAGEGGNPENAYIGRNQISYSGPLAVNPSGGEVNSDDLVNVWIEDNDIHTQYVYESSFIQVSLPDRVHNLRILNNRFYGSAPNVTSFGVTRPGWTIEGNSIRANQSPSQWDFR